VYFAEEVEGGRQYALKVVGATEPSLDAELGILRAIAAEVPPQALHANPTGHNR
jgi:hypothetical protein